MTDAASEAKRQRLRDAFDFATKHFAVLSVAITVFGATMAIIFIAAYLRVFDWRVIWVIEMRADPLDIDLSGFAPAVPKPKIEPMMLRQVSEANQFPSRAAPQPKAPPRPARRHRTGRNVQLNIKATARFTALADKHGLVFGELLARALDAFEAKN